MASLLCAFVGLALIAHHGSENENTLLPTLDHAPERIPATHSSHVGRLGLLVSNQHDVAEAVSVKTGHRSEILGEHFTLPGVERRDEILGGLLGSVLDFF